MALLILYKHTVKMPIIETPISLQIIKNIKYTLFFNNCISALNRTYILLIVGLEKQALYRNYKGFLL
jgi:hypothetical protein